MNYKIIWWAVSLLFYSSVALSQETHLWKVTAKNGKHVSYLFGTMHYMGESFYNEFPVLDKCLKLSDVVVTEVEIIRKDETSYGEPTDGLENILTKKEFGVVQEIFKNEKVDFRKFGPGEVTTRLQIKFKRNNCRYLNPSDEFFLDEYVQIKGKDNNKKMYYLETITQQQDYISRADSKASDIVTWKSAKFGIKTILRQYKKSKNSCSSLVNQYASFQLPYKFDETCENLNDYETVIRKERNEKWFVYLSSLIEHNNAFIAVGHGHLHYKCGIIVKLKDMGYVVEQVSMK